MTTMWFSALRMLQASEREKKYEQIIRICKKCYTELYTKYNNNKCKEQWDFVSFFTSIKVKNLARKKNQLPSNGQIITKQNFLTWKILSIWIVIFCEFYIDSWHFLRKIQGFLIARNHTFGRRTTLFCCRDLKK